MCCSRCADADGFKSAQDADGRGRLDVDDLYASDREASISGEWPWSVC